MTFVRPETRAARAGFEVGDVIKMVEHNVLAHKDLMHLREVLVQYSDQRKQIEMQLLHHGSIRNTEF
ncbi:MAG: hypothetical protein K2X77_16285 [Candidatus Obscuribacterales bacterium]|nr:hypothetical protein [Candidatus Obscuribacterales bacterium]